MLLTRLPMLVAALWWGGITALSFLAVPTLFATLGSPAVAGPVAAKLFSLQCWAGLLLGLALLLLLRRERSQLDSSTPSPEQVERMQRTLATMGIVILGMMLALLQEFGVAQRIVTARATGGDLKLWHAVGSAMVLGQWLCSGAVLWKVTTR